MMHPLRVFFLLWHISRQGVLQHLKFVMRSKSVDVQREAVRGVANISAEYAYTAVIAGAGALMPLVAMLSSPDFLCQR